MSLYVTPDRRSLREAEERAAADACSSVIAVHRESADEVRRKAFWAAVDAKKSRPKERALKLVRQG